MKINFAKISFDKKDFDFTHNQFKIKGTFGKISKYLVKFESNLTGILETNCIRCGETTPINIDENISLLITNGIYDKEDKLQVVEIDGDFIDFDKLIKDELISIESGYFHCDSCKQDKNIFEKEY